MTRSVGRSTFDDFVDCESAGVSPYEMDTYLKLRRVFYHRHCRMFHGTFIVRDMTATSIPRHPDEKLSILCPGPVNAMIVKRRHDRGGAVPGKYVKSFYTNRIRVQVLHCATECYCFFSYLSHIFLVFFSDNVYQYHCSDQLCHWLHEAPVSLVCAQGGSIADGYTTTLADTDADSDTDVGVDPFICEDAITCAGVLGPVHSYNVPRPYHRMTIIQIRALEKMICAELLKLHENADKLTKSIKYAKQRRKSHHRSGWISYDNADEIMVMIVAIEQINSDIVVLESEENDAGIARSYFHPFRP